MNNLHASPKLFKNVFQLVLQFKILIYFLINTELPKYLYSELQKEI